MEKLLVYIWQHKLMQLTHLRSTNGEKIEILNTGIENTDAGPDFFNAQIRIGKVVWAGNVEIHTQSSDWYKHHHHTDPAYNSVILHVVKEMDQLAICQNGNTPPHLVLSYSKKLEESYITLMQQKEKLACQDYLNQLTPFEVNQWKNRLLIERLEDKTTRINQLLTAYQEDWEEVCYIQTARYFGLGLNSEPFMRLARSLPLAYIRKHSNSLFQIEALLFGQSGLLEEESLNSSYAQQLLDEYHYLQKKFSLTPLAEPNWKLLRIRPANFPHVRIAQLAAFLHLHIHSFAQIREFANRKDIDALHQLYRTKPSEYWETHYRFSHPSPKRTKQITPKTIDIFIINNVIPLLFTYGQHNNQQQEQEEAINLLELIPAEQNKIVRRWKESGLEINNAYDSQAFIQLYNNYCAVKKCLHCRFGHKLLSHTADIS